jgi:hypothetical protein
VPLEPMTSRLYLTSNSLSVKTWTGRKSAAISFESCTDVGAACGTSDVGTFPIRYGGLDLNTRIYAEIYRTSIITPCLKPLFKILLQTRALRTCNRNGNSTSDAHLPPLAHYPRSGLFAISPPFLIPPAPPPFKFQTNRLKQAG